MQLVLSLSINLHRDGGIQGKCTESETSS